MRLGQDVRALRRERRWTQQTLAKRGVVSGSTVSLIELGRGDHLSLAVLARVVSALGARLSVRVYWHGEGLDRLRDRRHASLVERMVQTLEGLGWQVRVEVSFNDFGERGSVDILAFHEPTKSLLVIEVKSVIPDLQAMLAGIDRKARLAPTMARRLGWVPTSVSRLLVVPDDRTVRRRVADHAATFETTLPARTVEIKRWLRAPASAIAGILFLPDPNQGKPRRSRCDAAVAADVDPRSSGSADPAETATGSNEDLC